MRDILEELLAVPDEEEEQGVLEGLLRRMFGAAGERGGLERGAERESFPQTGEGFVETAGTLRQMPSGEGQAADTGREEPDGAEEEDGTAPAQALWQELEQNWQVQSAGDGLNRTQRRAEGEMQEKTLPALARQLEQGTRASARAGAPVRTGTDDLRPQTAAALPQAVEGSFGVKRIDRIFERDARRYDSQFYLY